MMNILSTEQTRLQDISLFKILKRANWQELKEIEIGHIFTDEHLASNWNNIDVQPESLAKGEATKGMRKITSPVLLLKSHGSKMAYILASESLPVYICSSFKRSKVDGYTLLFEMLPHVYSEYFFYMSKYDSWTKISYDIDENEKYKIGPGFKDVGLCEFDGFHENITLAETIFLSWSSISFLIPSLTIQRQRIDEAKMMEQIILDKMSEKERKFQQKEWLNEAHIRNSKHRLSNDIMPVRMAVVRLERFISISSDGVKLSSTIGKVSKQTVGDLLKNLIGSIQKVEEDIKILTESETAGEQPETIDVEHFVKEFCDRFASKYNRRFTLNIEVKDKGLKIKISHNSFESIFENVFSNAVRHGFTDDSREDYKIHVILSETGDGYCRIDIANNGNPISERGRSEYFVKGSFSGKTGNTGMGGARIFEICEKFSGRAIVPYSTVDFPVVVSIEFPIVSL